MQDSSSERGNTDFVTTSGHRSLPGEPLFSCLQLQSQLELARRVRQTPCSELGPRSFEVLFGACEGLAEGTLSGFDVRTTKGCVAHTLILHANHWEITVVQFTRESIRAVTSTVVEVSRFFVDELRIDYSVIHYRLIIIEPIHPTVNTLDRSDGYRIPLSGYRGSDKLGFTDGSMQTVCLCAYNVMLLFLAQIILSW